MGGMSESVVEADCCLVDAVLVDRGESAKVNRLVPRVRVGVLHLDRQVGVEAMLKSATDLRPYACVRDRLGGSDRREVGSRTDPGKAALRIEHSCGCDEPPQASTGRSEVVGHVICGDGIGQDAASSVVGEVLLDVQAEHELRRELIVESRLYAA